MNLRYFWMIAALILVSATGIGRAAEVERPTAAFINMSRHAIGPVLEQALLSSEKATWLERAEIDNLLRERELISLLSPAACGQRSTIGRLLRADLLVLLRHHSKPAENVQLIVSETRRGLRLAVHHLLLSPEIETDVTRLAKLVAQAIAKQGEEIQEIFAVPPFVSNNLTYENEHLKAAYGKLAEQAIRGRRGLLTVELEEARAIAKELGLAGDNVRRSVPLYVLGDFQHEGHHDGQKATIHIRVTRGQRELARREAAGLAPAAATDFVRQATAELIEEAVGVQRLRPNPQLEAEQLARRADTFCRLAGWEEAAALAEASLLLDHRQPRMHEVAFSSFAALASRDARYTNDPDTVARGIHCYLRALEHFDTLLPPNRPMSVGDQPWRLFSHLHRCMRWHELLHEQHSPTDVQQVAAELRDSELEFLLGIVRDRAKQRTGDAYRFLARAIERRPRQQKFDIMLQSVRSIAHLPHAERLVRELTLHGFTEGLLDNPEGREYLEQLLAFDNENVRRAATGLHDALLAYVPRAPSKRSGADVEPVEALRQSVRFEPVKIRYVSDQGWPLAPRLFGGCIPAGPGIDLVWDMSNCLYVMKQRGRAKRIWDSGYVDQMATQITGVKYDGRFAWVTTRFHYKDPHLLVVDPREERIWEIDEQDGLPVMPRANIPDPKVSPRLWVEPLGPGKALVVSWFGRLTMSTVTFDPEKGAKAEVFFEARHHLDPAAQEPWRDLHLAFPPGYVIGFRDTDAPDGPPTTILVGTHHHKLNYGRVRRPLVVDPATLHVEIASHDINIELEPGHTSLAADALFSVKENYPNLLLLRNGLPDFKTETLMSGVPETYCLKIGNKFLALGRRCWIVDPQAAPGERVRVMAARAPWKHEIHTTVAQETTGQRDPRHKEVPPFRFRRMCRSHHYGHLAQRFSRDRGHEFFRLVVEEE